MVTRLTRYAAPAPLLLCLILCGCALPQTHWNVSTSSVVARDFPPRGTSFAVAAADSAAITDEAQFARHADAVSALLEREYHWKRVPSPAKAACIVLLQYDMSAPQTGTNVVPRALSRTAPAPANAPKGKRSSGAEYASSLAEYDTHPYSYYITRYAVEVIVTSPLAGSRPGRQVWKGVADVRTSEQDLNISAGLAGGALIPHIGKSGGISQSERISGSNEAVQTLQ